MPDCDEGFEHACYKVEGKDMTVTISNETIKLVKQGDTWVPKVPDGDADTPNAADASEAAQAAEAKANAEHKAGMGKLDGGARRKRRSNKRKPKKSAKKPKRSKKGKTRKQKK